MAHDATYAALELRCVGSQFPARSALPLSPTTVDLIAQLPGNVEAIPGVVYLPPTRIIYDDEWQDEGGAALLHNLAHSLAEDLLAAGFAVFDLPYWAYDLAEPPSFRDLADSHWTFQCFDTVPPPDLIVAARYFGADPGPLSEWVAGLRRGECDTGPGTDDV